MTIRTQLAAVAAVLVASSGGCSRDAYDEHSEHSGAGSTAATAQPVERSIVIGWAQTSAANPVGWATRAERRQAEIDFATGAADEAPPSAIGGGPTDFELDDDD
jgi:hypothetical protein